MGLIGIFLLISAVIVLFPALLQMRTGESQFRHIWGYLIVVLGLALAAGADSRLGEANKTTLALAGVILALVGLVVQSKLPRPPAREDHDH